jgi:hypothetical protein
MIQGWFTIILAKLVFSKPDRTFSLPVMPVPDQVRDDGSGIQRRNIMKGPWIPGRARNDKTGVSESPNEKT